MSLLSFEGVRKSYNGLRALDGVSFEVQSGEIFGLLGPNGAGKTTLIRILMDILLADSGQILLDGKPVWGSNKDRIGYLPEERGLYRKQRVLDVLIYFGMLKGMERAAARAAAQDALRKVELQETAKKKIEGLSKGMQQKVQIMSTLLHDPDLIVLDEPFSGLDPLNTRMVKEILAGLKEAGKIVILSTHQMAQVEALCDRIAMIDRGKLLLYGPLREIRRSYSGNAVIVSGTGPWTELRSVERSDAFGDKTRLTLAAGSTARDFLVEAASRNAIPESYETAITPLEDIFVQVVRESHASHPSMEPQGAGPP